MVFPDSGPADGRFGGGGIFLHRQHGGRDFPDFVFLVEIEQPNPSEPPPDPGPSGEREPMG